MEDSLKSGGPVQPLKPIAPYQGGKRHLADRLVERINVIDHATYVDVFCGMGGVFFRRTRRPSCEVVNDLSRDIATFFRVVQRHYDAFVGLVRFTVASRVEFERLKATDPAGLTDLERAARFLYLQRLAFGGRVKGRTFGIGHGHAPFYDVTQLEPQLKDLHRRLAGVVIECLPYAEVISRWDNATTLFYLDPPYYGSEGQYGAEKFSRADYALMAEQLAGIKGAFILSLNDVPAIRRVFDAFHVDQVDTSYTISRGPQKRVAELVISNRKHHPAQGRLDGLE